MDQFNLDPEDSIVAISNFYENIAGNNEIGDETVAKTSACLHLKMNIM